MATTTFRARGPRPGKGIQLHTIQCGTDQRREGAWRKIASLGGGQYMAIHQDGGMQAEHSRYDDELASLHDKLGKTAIGYGAGAPRRRRRARRPRRRRRRSRRRARGSWRKNRRAVGGDADLVEGVASGGSKLAEVQGELPAT